MLAALSLAVLIAASPHSRTSDASRTCPAGPSDTFGATAQTCDAVEVTGRVDPGDVSLDPAFDVRAPLAAMARPAQGQALLTATDRNGAQIFAFPFAADGPFRLTLPLSPRAAQSIYRLTLTAGNAQAERHSSYATEPAVETIAVSDDDFVFIWNASAFPGVRIANARDRSPVIATQGTSTYEQIDVRSSQRTFVASFSDGVRSIDRTVTVLGR